MWEVTITVTNRSQRRIRAIAVRTEGVEIRIHTLNTIVPTGVTHDQIATGLANEFWDIYQAELFEESENAGLLGTIGSQAATKLDAKEPV